MRLKVILFTIIVAASISILFIPDVRHTLCDICSDSVPWTHIRTVPPVDHPDYVEPNI